MKTITFISTTEAANIAGVSAETIRQLCKAGTIKYQKRGQLYYPCMEDINRYANSIIKVHSIRKDINRYIAKLNQDREALLVAQQELTSRLETVDMFPTRIERIEKLVYSLLRQYSENRIEEFSEREIEVLFMMFRGESFESVGAQLSLSKERIRQVWVKILRKMIVVRNELEYKDLQIAALQKQILELQKIAKNKRFELVPQEIIDNIDLLCKPIETIPFTLRTQRGLAKTRIKTVWDLVQCNRNKIRYGSASIGMKSFQEIEQWLSEHNLKLGLALPPNIDLMQLKQKIDKA